MLMWNVTGSREVYVNTWIRVVEDQVVRPDGAPGVYGVVEMRRPSVFVVALTDDDEVLFVTVDRHTTGESVELPAGGTDGDDPLAAARRELLEETGATARDWREIGRMNALNGVCRAPEHVFLATGLERGAATGQAEEGISAITAVPWRDVPGLDAAGGITDGESIAALMFAAVALGRVN